MLAISVSKLSQFLEHHGTDVFVLASADLWYWDEDDQREWEPHPEWQELRDSWCDLGPELSQPLPLSNVGDPYCTDHILVRQAYLEIASRVLRRQEEAPGTGVLIMGQRGVGTCKSLHT